MIEQSPLVIAVAPNGARYTKSDHPQLPITPSELAKTALDCMAVGARMIHLHVRDDKSLHSIAPERYIPALKAVKDAVGDEMIIQVTSEAAGVYNAEQQMELMQQLMPDYMSLALKEFLPNNTPTKTFTTFIKNMTANGSSLQIILYDAQDYQLYKILIESEILTQEGHSTLYVLGRYSKQTPDVDIVQQTSDILTTTPPMMVCTFGPNSHQILRQSVDLNCNVRVGFENGFYLPDGTIAKDNAELVELSCNEFIKSGRTLANIKQTRAILGITS